MIKVDIHLKRKNFNVHINETFSNGITGIYGASGSGKTSLLHSIAGLENPEKGEISIGERAVYNTKEGVRIPVEKRNVGYVFQEGNLIPTVSALNNIVQTLKFAGASTFEARKRAKELLTLLGVEERMYALPTHLSGGERQRVALKRPAK